jgi:hypothetical protein
MGFLEGLGRFMQGKPIFQASENNDTSQHSNTTTEDTQMTASGPKVVPTVFIERSDYHNSGQNMRIEAYIKNSSTQEVEVSRINLMGTHRDININLRAGESREVFVYDGARPKDYNYKNAYLQFKDESGDYFESHHTVEFRSNQDGTYYISAFNFVGPVKDI